MLCARGLSVWLFINFLFVLQPVYCKDDFFDSLSCDALDHDSGKVKLSEQRKKDAEVMASFFAPHDYRCLSFFIPLRNLLMCSRHLERSQNLNEVMDRDHAGLAYLKAHIVAEDMALHEVVVVKQFGAVSVNMSFHVDAAGGWSSDVKPPCNT